MWTDTIVEEVRAAREAHAARLNYDLEAIYRDLKAQEQQGQRHMVSLPPKRYVRRRAAAAKPEATVAGSTSR
jgi:hypothetical protein